MMSSSENWLRGGGEMGARIRAFNWAETPLGAPDTWSPALRTMVRLLLANRFPHILWWGRDYIQFYNDPYRPIPGTKHPDKALGKPARECWSEIWDVIGPLIDTPFLGGPATWNDDIELEVNRHGFREESHFTIAYSPVPDDTVPSRIGGVLATVHEITEKVIAERRTSVLRDLGAHVGEAQSAQHACVIAAAALTQHAKELPFVLFYLMESNGERAELSGAAGVAAGQPISPLSIDLARPDAGPWPVTEALASKTSTVVEHLGELFADVPRGPWSDPPHTAVVVPVPTNKPDELAGFLIVGISSRLALDGTYRDFLDLVRTQVATAIASARAYEEERKRAEALAERTQEVIRAERALATAERMVSVGTLSAGIGHDMANLLMPLRVRLETLAEMSLPKAAERELAGIRSSADYLQKLATGLRLLAADPNRSRLAESTELRSWWSEAAPVLKSTLPMGVGLRSELPPGECWVAVSSPALIQAVFNLVQNAGDAMREQAKGFVTVRVEERSDGANIVVADTGPGMSDDVKRRCMEPFYTTKAREISTGLGLALVYGIVHDAGGTVELDSVPGKGTTFTLRFKRGGKTPKAVLGNRRRALVDIKDERMRAIVAAELQTLLYDVRFDAEGTTGADLIVADRNDVPRQGTVVLLTGTDHAPASTVALGDKPKVSAIREALRRLSAGA